MTVDPTGFGTDHRQGRGIDPDHHLGSPFAVRRRRSGGRPVERVGQSGLLVPLEQHHGDAPVVDPIAAQQGLAADGPFTRGEGSDTTITWPGRTLASPAQAMPPASDACAATARMSAALHQPSPISRSEPHVDHRGRSCVSTPESASRRRGVHPRFRNVPGTAALARFEEASDLVHFGAHGASEPAAGDQVVKLAEDPVPEIQLLDVADPRPPIDLVDLEPGVQALRDAVLDDDVDLVGAFPPVTGDD